MRNASAGPSTGSAVATDADVPPCAPLCGHMSTALPCPASCSKGAVGGKGTAVIAGPATDLVSLWPDPEGALFLEVDDKVPVCAFGQPCAVTPPRLDNMIIILR